MQYTCSNGECIPLDGICNQKKECSDGSDEDANYCRAFNHCTEDQFACGTYGKCISKDQFCNGEKDCEQGEDEENCPSNQAIVGVAIGAIFVVAILLVVSYVFWRKLKVAKQKLRNLTAEEVEEFLNGCINTTNTETTVRVYEDDPTRRIPWNKMLYEIPKDKLQIEWESVLGSGQFGTVYNAVFDGIPDRDICTSTPVAVKTFKSSADTEHLKSLLSELKIMTHVGKHENIVNLVGAYTQEITQRVLYMVVELCPFGSLESFLKKNRNSFVNLVDASGKIVAETETNKYSNVMEKNSQSFTTKDLIRWSHQMANGMEHLSLRNVTHGDLATRNILLSETFDAKISDFGLSRRLYESGIYVKKQVAPLPWRWMAIESLRDFEFTTQSDIWSYGTTIWEMYSLGAVPFPGLSWTVDFVEKLSGGLRMAKPAYATADMYQVMINCWENNPKSRPSFPTLKEFFLSVLENCP